jgi:hypothetical protein
MRTNQGTHSHEAVQHDREDSPVAPSDEAIRSLEGREEPARFFAIEHGRLAFLARKPCATDGRCGIGAQHTGAREPFEPLTDGAQVLVGARRTEASAEFVQVGGDNGGGEGDDGE